MESCLKPAGRDGAGDAVVGEAEGALLPVAPQPRDAELS
jgi:hypothetical protein